MLSIRQREAERTELFRRNYMNDKNKAKNTIEQSFTRLANSYVSVNGSFGGNQGWFEDLENKKKAARLTDFGCGLIGVGDILLYITGGSVLLPDKTDNKPK